MLAAIIADDLTGAADTGVQFARAGYRAAVVFRGEPVPDEELDAVVFDTDSRTRRPGLAARYVAEAGRNVRDARLVYKKFDSTLRGPVAAELSAAFESTRRRRAVVAPAFPAAGRTTAGGTQLVHGVPVHETEMRNDPRTPVRDAHVPTLLGRWSASVGTLGVDDLDDPENVRRALARDEWTVVDAERDADLEALVRAVPDPGAVLWAGSAGLAQALGQDRAHGRGWRQDARPLRPPRPDGDLGEREMRVMGLGQRCRHLPRAQHQQPPAIRPREKGGGQHRGGGGPPVGQGAAVEQRQRRAGHGVREQILRMHRRQAPRRVAGRDMDDLHAGMGFVARGHQQQRAALGHGMDMAQRGRAARREHGAQSGMQPVPRQGGHHRGLVELPHAVTSPIARLLLPRS